MAGINFMSFIEGQRLAEEDNIRDEDRWRKHVAEDRKAAYEERNQAYKEQTQGYDLDDYKEKAETVEASRFISQASDIYSAAAKAQGKPKWQVMLESPEFTVPDGSSTLQSKVQSGIRAGLVATEAMNLRAKGDYPNAERLEQQFGMSQRSDVGALAAYSNPQKAVERVSALFPGATLDDKGNFNLPVFGPVPYAQAVALTFEPNATARTFINQAKVNEQTAAQALAAQQGQAAQAQIQQINAQSADQTNRDLLRQHIASGYGREYVPTHLLPLYDSLKAAAPATPAGSPPITASIDAATAAPAPAPAPAAAPVAPAAIKNVAQAAPVQNTLASSPPIQFEQELRQVEAAESRKAGLDAQAAAIKKDIALMTGLQGRKHFDQATVDSARNKLLAITQKSQEEESLLSKLYSSVQRAPIRRPEYVNTLTTRYK